MTICIDSNIPFLPKLLKECGEVHLFHGRELDDNFLKETGCTALFVRSTVKINETLLKNTEVQFVATATAGTDHVDEEFLQRAGIIFKSAGGSNANAVAEYVIFAALLWADLLKTTLQNKTIGIIGYGHIGKRVAWFAREIGMTILVNDPPLQLLKTLQNGFPDYVHHCELPELIKNSDIITNHVPLTSKGQFPTKNLLDASHLELLKDNSLLIHASRGGIVQQDSLEKMLLKKRIFAAVDVWESEPDVVFKNPENLLLATPHIAGHTWNAKLNGTKMVAGSFKQWSGCAGENEFLQNDGAVENPGFSNEKFLLKILAESRKLKEDSEVFKKILTGNERTGGKFDEMRRKYPQRFESLGSHFDNF